MAQQKLVSPKAKCKWVNIKQPHPEYDTYQITLMLPIKSEEAKDLMSKIDGWVADEVKASGKKPSEHIPYKEDGDDIIFKFKQKPRFRGKNGVEQERKIMIVDSSAKPCNVDIGWGSTVKVSYNPVPYTVNGKSGVTLYFNAVQVIDLVEYDGSAELFEKEEGFISEESSNNPFVEENSNGNNEEDF